MLRLFSSSSHSITGAAIILGAASFVSRLIGVVRDRLLAHLFGAGDVLDAYYAAFRLPDFIFNLLLVGALTAGFIPIFLEIYEKDETRAWRVTNSLLNLVALLMAAVSAVLIALAPELTRWLVPGFSGEKLTLTVTLTRLTLLSPILLGLSGVVSSVLHAKKNFLVFALAPIVYNLGLIAGAVAFVPWLGPAGLAWGVALGSLVHLLIQIPTMLQHGWRYQPILDIGRDVRRIIKLTIPRTLGLAIHQVNLLVTTVIASTLSAGSVAIFNLANNLQYFPVGIIGHSFSLAAFPTLAKLAAEGERQSMVDHFSRTARQIIFLIVPVTVIFLLLRAQITRVALGSGQFDWTDTVETADTLALFVLSLFAQCLALLIARAFYALQDTWTPFLVGLIGAAVHVAASLMLKNYLGVGGLALAYSLATALQLAVLWLLLRRRVGSLGENQMLASLYKISAAALVMAVVVQYLKMPLAAIVDMTRFWGIFSQGLVSGTVGLLVYGAICRLLKLEEMALFESSLHRRWLRLWTVRENLETRV